MQSEGMSAIVQTICRVALVWLGFMTLSASTPLDEEQAQALQFARDFTANFVADSCTGEHCRFLPDKSAEAVSTENGMYWVTLQGRRRVENYGIEERAVTAKLKVQRLAGVATAPNFVILDFSFQEGRRIPIPSK